MMAYTRGAQRRRQHRQVSNGIWLIIFSIALLVFAVKELTTTDAERVEPNIDGSLTYVVSRPDIDEEILNYEGFTVSFNPTLHIPNWVAWELTADEVSSTEPRADSFNVDPNVKGCATPRDYTHSGYDRGHMAPAGDMKWSHEAMDQTFLMTNIVPQAGKLNRGTWRHIEEKCRARALRDSAVVIVCGPIPGERPIGYLGQTGVAIPKRFFKVILSPYANPPRAIGFIVDNGDTPGGMQAAAVSVDEVEALTGYDFFSALDDELENRLESSKNFTQWSMLK